MSIELRKFSKSEFYRNLFTLMSGTVLAQAIPILLSPILSRIYPTEDFGVYTAYFAILSILSIIVTLRYELAVMLPKEDVDAEVMVFISFGIACAISLIFLFIIIFLHGEINPFFTKTPDISFWLYFIPLSVALNGFIQVFSYWVNRKKQYKKLAFSKAFLAGLSNIVPLIIFKKDFCHGALVMGLICGQVASIIYFCITCRKDLSSFLKMKNSAHIKKLLIKYKEFPKFNTLSSCVNQMGSSLPPLFIASFYGIETAGLFGMTMKVLSVPTALVSFSLSQVLFQKLSESYNHNISLKPIISSAAKKLMMIGIAPYLIILIFGNPLFHLIFGKIWGEAGTYAQIIALSCFVSFIVSPLSLTLAITQKLKEAALWQFSYFLENIIIILIVYYFHLNIFCYLYIKAPLDIILYVIYFRIIVNSINVEIKS